MHKLLNKQYWKKGSAETMAFMALAPTMLILFALLATIVQVTSFKEKLEYTTYVAARAAAVSETQKTALENAKKAAEADLASYGDVYDPGSLKVEVSTVAGSKWKKGGYMRCKVSVDFKGTSSLADGKKSFEMVMAIEKADEPKKLSTKKGSK